MEKRQERSEMASPARNILWEQEDMLSVVVKLHSEMNEMLGEVQNRIRLYGEEYASPVNIKRRKLVGWTEIKQETSENFMLGVDIFINWIEEEFYRVTKEWFRYLRTELVMFLPYVGVP